MAGFSRKAQEAAITASRQHYQRMRKSKNAPSVAPKFIFRAWSDRLALVTNIIRHKMRHPAMSSWEKVPSLFGPKDRKFDIHDCIQFCSRIGVYVIIQLQLPANVESIIVNILLAYEDCTRKFFRVADLPSMQLRLLEAFAKCDLDLPSHLATAVRHFMQHILGPLTHHGAVRRFGPFFVWSMLTAEQYNKYIKSLSKTTKSIEEGLARGYSSRFHILQQKLTKNPSLIDPPTYVLPGSHIELPSRDAAMQIQVLYQIECLFYQLDDVVYHSIA